MVELRRGGLVAATLVLALSACGDSGGAEPVTSMEGTTSSSLQTTTSADTGATTTTEVVEDETTTTAESSEPSAPPELSLDQLEDFELPVGFDSYRLHLEHWFEDDGEVTGAIEATAEVSSSEGAALLHLEASDSVSFHIEGELVERRSVGQVRAAWLDRDVCRASDYSVRPRESTSSPSIGGTLREVLPSEYLTGTAELAEAEVEVNGRIAHRYTLTTDNFVVPEPGWPGMRLDSITTGDVFVDASTGSLISIHIEGTGQDTFINNPNPALTGEIHIRLDFSGFDEPVSIVPFETCWFPPQTPFPYPEPLWKYQRDAEDRSLEYTTLVPIEDVVAFYADVEGWTLVEEVAFSDDQRSLTFDTDLGEVTIDLLRPPRPGGGEAQSTLVFVYMLGL